MAKGDIVPANAKDADTADDEGPTGTDLAETTNKAISASPKPVSGGGSRTTQGPAFFTIYKKGQGKWTRLGTVFAAALLGLLTAYAIYQNAVSYLPAYDPSRPADHSAAHGREAIAAGVGLFVVGFALLVYWASNKPKNVDFLIATDSEMKKVNWTTKGELLGSTRVVVLFLVFIALFLLAVDLTFNWFFHLIRVLQT